MKQSNFFILISALVISAPFFVNLFRGQYVTDDAFHRNQQESVQYLDSVSYNYQTIRWNEPFDEIVIRDTSRQRWNNNYENNELKIQWVKSDGIGAKWGDYSGFEEDMNIQDNRLVIYCSSDRSFLRRVLYIYSPTLKAVTLHSVANLKLINTRVDSLSVVADSAVFTIARSTYVKALDVHATRSTLTIQTDTLFDANYVLNARSVMKNQVDSCGNIAISGDSTATMWLSPYIVPDSGVPLASIYGNARFTEMSGKIIIENSKIQHIYGNREQLTLHMGVPQIRETLANVVDE